MPYETISSPKVLTDGYVDTSSIESIVEGVLKLAPAAKTDEEKILALYQWYRRLIFHHRFMAKDRRDVLKVINSYGCNLCGSQASVLVILLQKMGYKTKVVCGDGPGDMGNHTFVEVFYDDRWHCYDTMTGFAVFTRDEPPHVASLAELKADPTLVQAAVEEKRGVPGFLYCMGHQEMSGSDRDKLAKTMGGKDLIWSTLLFKDGTLLDFWAKAPGKSKTLDDGGIYGGKRTAGVMDFTLKPGEELVREWDNAADVWFKRASHKDFGPHHTCGVADENDEVNFKWFEPYLKENFGHTKKCYRWFGNGYLEWQPTGAEDEAATAFRAVNLNRDAGGRFSVAAAGTAGSLTIPVKCPYAGVAVELELDLKQAGAEDVTRVFLEDAGNTSEVWSKTGACDGIERISVIPSGEAALFEYALRIETGAASFAPVRLRTILQENIYALPGLVPGKNVISVSAAAPVKLAAGRLVVAYEWAEGEGWKTDKTVRKTFTELPASFEVEVAGPKMPRMKRLIVRLETGPSGQGGK